jgi:hypothetical protein
MNGGMTMKKIASIILTTLLIFSTFIVPKTEVQAATVTTGIPVYRMYNKATGEHLYTTDVNERNILFKDWDDWGYEGVAWYAPITAGDGVVPVYRLYNNVALNHLYTTDINEARTLVNLPNSDWVMDNGGNPILYSGGFYSIYRLYNEGLKGMHHLTTDYNEYNSLPKITNGQWVQENCDMLAMKIGTPLSNTMYYDGKNVLTDPEPNINTDASYTGVYNTIENVDSYAAIEADVTLNGTGTGAHGKLVICTSTSAVSFGLQYDQHAVAPYTGKTMVMIENVTSNNSGGQTYDRPGNRQVNLGEKVHLMITLNRDGSGKVYMNGEQIGTFTNTELAGQEVYLRVEGSARINGDSVDAKFENIKLKQGSTYDSSKIWGTYEFKTNTTISSVVHSWNNIEIQGTVTGLGNNEDWDNAYDRVSDIIQFVQ